MNDSIELALARRRRRRAPRARRRRRRAPRARAPARRGCSACRATTDSTGARGGRARGADYVAIGSVFASPTKPAARARAARAHGAAHAALRACRSSRSAASRSDNAPRGDRAPAPTSLAVISALFDAPDVAARGARIRRTSSTPQAAAMTNAADEPLRTRAAPDPRRRELAGARLPRRRRHAAFFVRGGGPHVWDADGKRYIDYVGSWGPLILGHAHPDGRRGGARGGGARALVRRADRRSRSSWPSCSARRLPSLEQVRLVSSGTEATMSALRLARGFTGRAAHRQVRGLLPRPRRLPAGEGGLGRAHLRQPQLRRRARRRSPRHTLVLDYNDVAAARRRRSRATATRSRR